MEPFNTPIQGYDGWNVNQSYLTPAYMANFRPQYAYGDYSQNAFAENTSFTQSAWRAGPGDYRRGSDVLQTMESDYSNLSSAAMDASVFALQNVAIPAAAWYGVSKLNKTPGFLRSGVGAGAGSTTMAGSIGTRAGRWGSRAFTGAAGQAASRVGLGGVAGSTPAKWAATQMARGAGSIGGFVGGVTLPIAAAIAASSAIDSTLVNPYVHTRRGMDAMRANTANQFISGEGGSAGGGFGMSAVRAQKISQALTVAGQKDFMLDGGEYNEIADNMMRAGMFQEIGDMDTTRIVDGVKKATSVLKLIQRITGDPDIKNGIKAMATLKSGGLDDIEQMGHAITKIRTSSAVAGIGMEQMMDTIGSQGAVMAQQNGIQANTGMLASADAFAGFTNARKLGLISGSQSAMLGGVEGMTQNSMQAAYSVMNTGINRMLLQSGGNLGQNTLDSILGWGGQFSSDPASSMGDFVLNRRAYEDDAMNEYGASSLVLESLKAMSRDIYGTDTNGNYIASLAAANGISPEQIRSIALLDQSKQDPRFETRWRDAAAVASRSDKVTELQNHNMGLYGIPVIGTAQKFFNESTSLIREGGANLMSPLTELAAQVSDGWAESILDYRGIEDAHRRTFRIQRADDAPLSISADSRYLYSEDTQGDDFKSLVNDSLKGTSKERTLAKSIFKSIENDDWSGVEDSITELAEVKGISIEDLNLPDVKESMVQGTLEVKDNQYISGFKSLVNDGLKGTSKERTLAANIMKAIEGDDWIEAEDSITELAEVKGISIEDLNLPEIKKSIDTGAVSARRETFKLQGYQREFVRPTGIGLAIKQVKKSSDRYDDTLRAIEEASASGSPEARDAAEEFSRIINEKDVEGFNEGYDALVSAGIIKGGSDEKKSMEFALKDDLLDSRSTSSIDTIRLEGYEFQDKTTSGRRARSYTEKVKSKKFDSTISAINSQMTSNVEENRDLAEALTLAIAEGDDEKAKEYATELNDITGGAIFGFESGHFKATHEANKLAESIRSGELVGTVLNSDDSHQVDRGLTLEGEKERIFSIKDDNKKVKSIEDLMSTEEGIEKAFTMAGYAGTEVTDDSKGEVFDKLMQGTNSYEAIDNNLSLEEKYNEVKRIATSINGISDEDFEMYVKRANLSQQHIVDRFTTTVGNDITDNVEVFRNEIVKSKQQADAISKGSKATDIQWGEIRDVKSGMVALGMATQENTVALQANTLAMTSRKDSGATYGEVMLQAQELRTNSRENSVKQVNGSTSAPLLR